MQTPFVICGYGMPPILSTARAHASCRHPTSSSTLHCCSSQQPASRKEAASSAQQLLPADFHLVVCTSVCVFLAFFCAHSSQQGACVLHCIPAMGIRFKKKQAKLTQKDEVYQSRLKHVERERRLAEKKEAIASAAKDGDVKMYGWRALDR